jgi:alpha-methylacyl-CoA racemase
VQALSDVKVVCLSAVGPVPFATMLLGDFGAQVTRVDRPGRPGSLTGLALEDDPRSRGHRADFGGGGAYLARGVLVALHQRQLTGHGQVVDAAMVDGVASLTTMLYGMLAAGLWSDRRGDNLLDGAAHFYRTYGTEDGGFMAVGPIEPQFYRELLDVLGLDQDEWPQHDRTRWPELSGRLAAIFASRTRAHWEQAFAGRDACVTPVLSLAEAGASAELRERGTFVDWGGVPQPAPAPRLSASPASERPRSRWCGHTDQVLAELGYQADELARLRAAGTVA